MFGLCCRVFIFLIYLCPFPLIKWGSSSWGTLLIRTKDFSNSEFFFLTFFFGYFIPARSNHNLRTPVWHPSHMLYTSPNISYSLSTDCSRVFVGTLQTLPFGIFFFCALYQKNKVWDLMGSCLNQVPLILILTQCSIQVKGLCFPRQLSLYPGVCQRNLRSLGMRTPVWAAVTADIGLPLSGMDSQLQCVYQKL